MNKEFLIKNLFNIINNPQLDKENFIFSERAKYPYFTRTENNNGIYGYVKYFDDDHLIPGNSLAVGMISMQFHYMQHDFYAGQFTKTLIPKFRGFNENLAMYFIAILNKHSEYYQSYLVRHFKEKISETVVELPVIEHADPNHEYTVDDIDWQYMEDRIKELEEDRIKELDAYLKVTNLDDYELTDEDKKVLSLSRKLSPNENGSLETDCQNGTLRFKKFNIGASYTMRGKTIDVDKDGLFNIIPTKKKINAIDIEFNGNHPYVARGEGGNGIRGYIDYDEKYLNEANTISFGQDTATVNYQSQKYFTGDKIQVFKLNEKYGNLTEDKAIYLINSIKKAFERFLWGQQSYALDIISKIKIILPITPDGELDFDYMEHYIRAIEKLTIADVVKYKDKVIDTTKMLVNSQS